MKHYIGIDPGKTGGIVVINTAGDFISKHPIPLIGKDIDTSEFATIFENIVQDAINAGAIPHACIEKVHALFGSSASGTFSFGYCVGLIDGIVRSKKIAFTKIQPKDWQAKIWQTDEIEREPSTIDKKGRVKQGKIKTKIVSLKAFKRIFPNVDLRPTERSKNQSDGLVDAILIAESIRRMNH